MPSAGRSDGLRVRWWRSIRLPYSLGVALVTIAVLLTVGWVVDQRAAAAARERLRAQGLARLEAAVALYAVAQRPGGGVSLDPAAAPAPLRAATGTVGAAGTWYDGTDMFASVLTRPGVRLTVRLSGESLRRERADLRAAMVRTAVPGVLLAALLAWLVASGLSGRLRRGARAASQIDLDTGAAGATGISTAVGGHDEVAILTRAVEDMAGALAARLDRERRFSADVAHELRTPVTALVSSAELLDPADPATALVRSQVGRVRRLVEDLLELFRAESGALDPPRPHSLAGLVTGQDTDGVQVWVVRDGSVFADPDRVDRILANLLTNARRHGGGTCQVTVAAPELSVTDSGPGLPAEILAAGPRRFVRRGSAPGSGLGLAIVQGLAASLDAQLILANPPEGGARVTVRFRPAPPG